MTCCAGLLALEPVGGASEVKHAHEGMEHFSPVRSTWAHSEARWSRANRMASSLFIPWPIIRPSSDRHLSSAYPLDSHFADPQATYHVHLARRASRRDRGK